MRLWIDGGLIEEHAPQPAAQSSNASGSGEIGPVASPTSHHPNNTTIMDILSPVSLPSGCHASSSRPPQPLYRRQAVERSLGSLKPTSSSASHRSGKTMSH